MSFPSYKYALRPGFPWRPTQAWHPVVSLLLLAKLYCSLCGEGSFLLSQSSCPFQAP